MGENMSPSSLNAKELGNLLIEFQESVLSIARKHQGKSLGDLDNSFSLKEVKNESAGYHFYSDHPKAYDAGNTIIGAVNNKTLVGLPRESFVGIKMISKIARQHNCNAEISNNGNDNAVAVLTPEDKLITPEDVIIKDKKDFYGEITRVGGIEYKVRFKTFGGTIHNAITSKMLAKKAAEKLYQTVKIKADVRYVASTYEIEEINIIDVEDFEVQSNTELFNDLRSSLGKYSNKYGSDLNEYIND